MMSNTPNNYCPYGPDPSNAALSEYGIKRAAEEEVQFISSKPVKRLRGAGQTVPSPPQTASNSQGQAGQLREPTRQVTPPLQPGPRAFAFGHILCPPYGESPRGDAPTVDPGPACAPPVQDASHLVGPPPSQATPQRGLQPAFDSQLQQQHLHPDNGLTRVEESTEGLSRPDAAKEVAMVERRGSTGGVEMPSQIPPLEQPSMIRGISLPSMERFTFAQDPSPRRPTSSPPLSPKQLPQNPSTASWVTGDTPAAVEPLRYPMIQPNMSYQNLLDRSFVLPSAMTQGEPMDIDPSACSGMSLPPIYAQGDFQTAIFGNPNFTGNSSMTQLTQSFVSPTTAGCLGQESFAPAETQTAGGVEGRVQGPGNMDQGRGTTPRLQSQFPTSNTDLGQTNTTFPSSDTEPQQSPAPQTNHPISTDGCGGGGERSAVPGRHPCLACQRLRHQACLSTNHNAMQTHQHQHQHVNHMGGPCHSQPSHISPPPSSMFQMGPSQNQTAQNFFLPLGNSQAMQMPAPLNPAMRLPAQQFMINPQTQQFMINPLQPMPSAFPFNYPPLAAPLCPSGDSHPSAPAAADTQSQPKTTSAGKSRASAAGSKAGTAAGAKAGTGGGRSRRKYSPNLYVDVAETCQEGFPYEEVARRHNVSKQKVVDVLQGVVQLPLLRCATDKRRAGKLGTARMREYNKAKKDLQADPRPKQQPQKQQLAQPVRPQSQVTEAQQHQPTLLQIAQSMPPLNETSFGAPW